MSDTKTGVKPKTKNRSSDSKRIIKMSLNVQKINKDWLIKGEKGVYLPVTFMLMPDGEVDQHGNLGMIIQDVPKAVYDAETKKKVKKENRTRGEILGNGTEFDWLEEDEASPEKLQNMKPGLSDDIADDLPF